ncbi:Uncharacterised protein [Legionella pneumophila]|nr:Uncharacterised protein [Legionella pneumophila]CZG06019.1 Uncharacterised protein [Legionella pneumophila]CZG28684.1 Uncharacterised protein [Legionella pneumophila]CZG28770.1 Uncharacterised protein [Legionella pneumophila]CZG29579.1 Uncharacterised protein [Legionella pneumophila]
MPSRSLASDLMFFCQGFETMLMYLLSPNVTWGSTGFYILFIYNSRYLVDRFRSCLFCRHELFNKKLFNHALL